MDRKAPLRLAVPLALLLALALAALEAPLSVSALGLPVTREGGYGYQDLTPVLPEGIEALRDAVRGGSGALLAGQSWSGRPFLADYDASRPDATPSWVTPPAHYGDLWTLAQLGDRYLVGGDSVGPAPVLGLYDPATASVSDLSHLLPPGATGLERVVGRPTDTGLAVLRTASGLAPALVRPGEPSLQVREVPGFENLKTVAAAVWNGSAYYVAGPTGEGDPSLLAWNPGTDAVTDLGPQVAEELDRIDRLVWNGTTLFILGINLVPFPLRGAVLAFHPETGALDRVAEDAFRPFDRMEAATWNGTALLFVGRQGATRRLAVYTPANDTGFVQEEAIPPQWAYLNLIPRGDDVLLAGNRDGPVLGLLHLPSWTFTDRTRSLERGYRAVAGAAPWGTDFVLAGLRTASPVLGLLRANLPSLEDRSAGLGLEGMAFLGAAPSADGVLLVGTNGTSASLYAYDPDDGRLTNRTAEVPPDVAYLTSPVTNGTVVFALGSQAGRPFALQVDADGQARNRSAGLAYHFSDLWRAVPLGDAFLLIGRNDQGPALATLQPADGGLAYHGDLGRRLGDKTTLHAGGANGAGVLLGGDSGGEPWMALWSPETDTLRDASSRLPDSWTGVTDIAHQGPDFLVGGWGVRGATLGVYHPGNGSFTDLSSLVPPAYDGVLGLVPGLEAILVVGWTDAFRPAAGLLTEPPAEGTTTLDLLRDLGLSPLLLAAMGLSVALAATLGYLFGRRRSPPGEPGEPYYPGPGEF